jgi:hypothetical protein
MPMRVQGQQHGCAFVHDAHAGMTTPVNATLVPFGQTKPSLQIKVDALLEAGFQPAAPRLRK